MPGSAHSAGSFDFLLQAMNKSLTSPHSAPIQKDAAVRTADEAFTSKSSRSSIVVIIIVQGGIKSPDHTRTGDVTERMAAATLFLSQSSLLF